MYAQENQSNLSAFTAGQKKNKIKKSPIKDTAYYFTKNSAKDIRAVCEYILSRKSAGGHRFNIVRRNQKHAQAEEALREV